MLYRSDLTLRLEVFSSERFSGWVLTVSNSQLPTSSAAVRETTGWKALRGSIRRRITAVRIWMQLWSTVVPVVLSHLEAQRPVDLREWRETRKA